MTTLQALVDYGDIDRDELFDNNTADLAIVRGWRSQLATRAADVAAALSWLRPPSRDFVVVGPVPPGRKS